MPRQKTSPSPALLKSLVGLLFGEAEKMLQAADELQKFCMNNKINKP